MWGHGTSFYLEALSLGSCHELWRKSDPGDYEGAQGVPVAGVGVGGPCSRRGGLALVVPGS